MERKCRDIIAALGLLLAIGFITISENGWDIGMTTVEAADLYTPLYYTMARDAVVITNSLSLNKRSQPSTSGEVTGKLAKGQHITVVGIS